MGGLDMLGSRAFGKAIGSGGTASLISLEEHTF
jgi:hypothetical protein